MKKKLIIITISIFIIIIYTVYKIFNLYYYNINNSTTEEYSSIINNLKVSDTITIKTKTLNDNDYMEFKGIKIKNYFEDFKKLEIPESSKDFVKYVLYSEEELVSSFWMGEAIPYTKILNSSETSSIYGIDDVRLKHIDVKKFLRDNNIENDIDLFKFLIKNKDVKNNFFTSVNKMKSNFYIQYLTAIALPSLKSITLIDGSYTGYIFNTKGDIKEVSLLKNGKRYIFTFLRLDYFTDEYIQEILNTVIID